MGYAIVGGIGLLGSLGIMIWALVERNKRLAAEREADQQAALRAQSDRIAAQNAAAVSAAKAETDRARAELQIVREKLKEAYDRLVRCEDPQTIQSWLDSELKGGVI